MCAKFESDSCIISYIFRTITKIYTPVKIITDIYTAPHRANNQLLPELLSLLVTGPCLLWIMDDGWDGLLFLIKCPDFPIHVL